MSSPLAPLLLLACCAAFELFRAGLGVNMALRTLTFLFIGGASSTSRLLSCQSVDGDGHSLGEWAFRSAVPTLRCSNGDGLGFWVDLVGYSSAVAYGLLIPLFLACLMLWQSFALQEARLIYAHATVEHEKSTLQLQTLQGRMSMDEVLPKRLLAAAAAHLSVHCRGEMLVNLEDEKVVLTSLGQPQGDFYEEEPMDPMKLVADQQTAKNLDRLRSKRLFEMLLERLMLAEARGSDRLLTGAQPLLTGEPGTIDVTIGPVLLTRHHLLYQCGIWRLTMMLASLYMWRFQSCSSCGMARFRLPLASPRLGCSQEFLGFVYAHGQAASVDGPI
eukprot:g12095.t1